MRRWRRKTECDSAQYATLIADRIQRVTQPVYRHRDPMLFVFMKRGL